MFMIVGGSLITVALVWALVLGWWQANDFTPASQDLILYLGLLPLALVGGFWLLRGFIEHLKAPAGSPAGAAFPQDEDPLASASARIAARERGYTLLLIGSAATAGHGASAMELLDSLGAGRRPELDKVLRDDAGFPVFCARAENLDCEGMTAKIAALPQPLPAPFRDGEGLRALALLDASLPPLLAQAGECLAVPTARLHVTWLTPADWGNEPLPVLQSWLRDHYLGALDKTRLDVALRPVASDTDALLAIDEIILDAGDKTSSGDLFLVLGAASHVGEATLQAWSARNLLFSPQRQAGQIPGECAVGLLFAAGPSILANVASPVRVSRISSALRDKPADAPGRIQGALVEQLMAGLLTVAGVEASAVKAIVADCDHRPSRVGELLHAVGNLFEALDPVAACPRIGTASGSLSPFGGLLALACAAAKATAEDGPAICLSNQHPSARAALLVAPWSEPSPPQAGGASPG